jgi:hypothetical protein
MPPNSGKKDASNQGGDGGSELERMKRMILDKAKEVGSPHAVHILGDARRRLGRMPTANRYLHIHRKLLSISDAALS